MSSCLYHWPACSFKVDTWGWVLCPGGGSEQYSLKEGRLCAPLLQTSLSLGLYGLHISLQPYIHHPTSLTSRQELPLFMNPLYHLLTDSLTASLAERNVVRSAWDAGVFFFLLPQNHQETVAKFFFFRPMQNTLNIFFSNLECFIFMHVLNVRTTKAADVSLIPPNNSKAVVGCEEFLKTIHADTMRADNMNTIWDTHLGMYDIQSRPSVPFLWGTAPSERLAEHFLRL